MYRSVLSFISAININWPYLGCIFLSRTQEMSYVPLATA